MKFLGKIFMTLIAIWVLKLIRHQDHNTKKHNSDTHWV